MGRNATYDFSYFDDTDLSVKADRGFSQFSGTRSGFGSFLSTSLVPHLQGRGGSAAEMFALAVFGELQVLCVTNRDHAKLAVLGKAGRWSAYSPDAEGIAPIKTEIPPDEELYEAPLDHPARQDNLSHLFPTEKKPPSPAYSSPYRQVSNESPMFPELSAEKLRYQALARDRLPSMQAIVDAVAVEDRQCNVQQYVAFAAMLRRLIITEARPTVVLLSQENPSYDGIDLFLALLERYGTRSEDSASTSLERLLMPYNDAIKSGIVSGPLDMLTMLLGARNALGENDMSLPPGLMKEYILKAFVDSPLSSYVEDVRMRTDKSLSAIVQDIQELGAQHESEAAVRASAKVNKTDSKVESKIEAVPPGELLCPVQCARGHHPPHQPCPGLMDLLKQWGWKDTSTRFCTHCKKRGHTVEGCFELHPEQIPPNWVCEICKKHGHFSRHCPQRAGTPQEVKLSDADLKAVANAIYVQAREQPTQPPLPPRIQVHP